MLNMRLTKQHSKVQNLILNLNHKSEQLFNWINSMKNYFLFFVVTVTLAFSSIVNAQENEPVQTQIIQSKAILTLNEETHDFGTIPEGPNAECEFVVTNTGTEPLIINSVTAGCGCTVPSYSKEPVLPGQTTKIKVVYHTSGRPGPFTKSVNISSNSSTGESKIIFIKGTVQNKQ